MTAIRVIRIRVRVPRVAAAAIRGRGLVEEIRYHHLTVVLLQLLLSTKNLTSREVKARSSLHFCLTFVFESIAARDLI